LDIVTDVAVIVGLVRDVLLLFLLAAALIMFLILIRKVIGLINAASRMAQKAEEMIDLVSEKVVQPATSNPRGLRMLGRSIGFVAGMAGGRKRKGDKDDGK